MRATHPRCAASGVRPQFLVRWCDITHIGCARAELPTLQLMISSVGSSLEIANGYHSKSALARVSCKSGRARNSYSHRHVLRRWAGCIFAAGNVRPGYQRRFFLTAAVNSRPAQDTRHAPFLRLASAWHGSCECFRKNTRGRSRCAKSAHLERAKRNTGVILRVRIDGTSGRSRKRASHSGN